MNLFGLDFYGDTRLLLGYIFNDSIRGIDKDGQRTYNNGGENMEDLKNQIKKLIIDTLELEDITPEDIVDSEPIFGAGLGLDSIDALELGVALKKKFGIKFSSESADNKKHFASVESLAAFITAEKEEHNP
jgi:acyl carrier protein